jgi:tetratricopeptide (TPR) repeat protein
VRISAQLIDPVTGAQVWAENYDRDLADIFAVQSEISLQVARALDATLSPEDVDRLSSVPTEDLTAYDLYLEGRQAYYEYQEEANERAIQLFKQAIARDSLYALAWAGLGDSYGQYVSRWDGGLVWADSAAATSRKAIALEPDLSEGHKALGLAYSQLGQVDSTIAAYRRALERNPNNADAANNLGMAHTGSGTGEYDKAIRWYRVAERLRPHRFTRGGLTIVYSYLNLYDRARAWMEKDREIEGVNEENLIGELHLHYPHGRRDSALSAVIRRVEVDPTDAGNREAVAWVALWAGDLELAETHARDAIRFAPEGTSPGYKNPWTTLAAVALARGDTLAAEVHYTDALAYLDRFLERDFGVARLSYEVAMLHGTMGHVDETIEWLEKAYDLGGSSVAWLWEQEPAFDAVRDDSRYMALLAKVEASIDRMRAQVLADEQAAVEELSAP